MAKHTTEKYYAMITGIVDGTVTSVNHHQMHIILKRLGFHELHERHRPTSGRVELGEHAHNSRVFEHQSLPNGMHVSLRKTQEVDEVSFRHLQDALRMLHQVDHGRFDRLATSVAPDEAAIELTPFDVLLASGPIIGENGFSGGLSNGAQVPWDQRGTGQHSTSTIIAK